jgi:hypothetical protein
MRLQLHSLLTAKSHRLSSPLINYWVGSNLMRVYYESKYSIVKVNIQTIIINNSHATLVLVWLGHESWENSHANSRFSTLINFSCNSCSRLTGAWELRKLSCKLSLLNSHQLSYNSCSRLTGARELRKLSCKLSLLNSHATLVLVWPGHESWDSMICWQRSNKILFFIDILRDLLKNEATTLILSIVLIYWLLHDLLKKKQQHYIFFYWERSNIIILLYLSTRTA